jgi:peptide/nickel transport system permease protein
MRFIDILISIPSILLAIAIVAALGPGMINLMIAVGIGSIPGYTRITRAAVLTIREREFVEAARAIGANDFRIITRHILPNCLAPIIVQATLGLSGAILSAAALSFIGLGIQPPTPEWGFMLSDGRRFIREHWHMVTFPGLAIVTVVLAINMVGDGLRDALDPKLKK